MKNSMEQKEKILADQFNARSVPAIPENWQKNLMDAVRREPSPVRDSILEDDRFVFRFAVASALSAAAALVIFFSVYFYVGQSSAESKTSSTSILYGGIENIVDTI